jgi:hypothetical protein
MRLALYGFRSIVWYGIQLRHMFACPLALVDVSMKGQEASALPYHLKHPATAKALYVCT